jgi:ATP-dependent helicase IRC3
MDRFTTLEQAVEAVDYEIDQMGRAASASARDDAPWRNAGRAEQLRLAVWKATR